jgi:hypothetical protein
MGNWRRCWLNERADTAVVVRITYVSVEHSESKPNWTRVRLWKVHRLNRADRRGAGTELDTCCSASKPYPTERILPQQFSCWVVSANQP